MSETFMNKEIIEAGTSPTAPSTATATAATLTKPASTKVMVLAVHHDTAGKLVITPIDVEHEQDDQRDLSSSESETGANMLVAYREGEDAMKRALAAL